jgi:hypothetical protein
MSLQANFVIARDRRPRGNPGLHRAALDCFAALAMMKEGGTR